MVVVIASAVGIASSFLPWHGFSVAIYQVSESASVDAWRAGVGAWAAVLLLAAAGCMSGYNLRGRWSTGTEASDSVAYSLIASSAGAAVVMVVIHAVTYHGHPTTFSDFHRWVWDLLNEGYPQLQTIVTSSATPGVGLYLCALAAFGAASASIAAQRRERT